ncbi:amidohydrolase family protein [Pigmentiphaga soli]|uniref:Amidohydrolase family protein n=1 Tax=Pigmentiphaga soli TaxID=1007095 RepID=A0ABP8GQU6_9BURK
MAKSSSTGTADGPVALFGVRHEVPAAGLPGPACDCHVHVLDPQRFPYDPDRGYTPRTASAEHLLQHQAALGFGRVVIVQPSAYGTDNRCLLDAIRRVGPSARGVAVIAAHTSDQALAEMDLAGVRGVRVNLESFGKNEPVAAAAALRAAAARVAPLGWHVQIYTNLAVIDALRGVIDALPTPLVIDHLGKAPARLGTGQPGFGTLLALLRSGKVWVKLSGAHRVSELPDCDDAAPLVHALCQANPDRLVWGSDWPHTGAWPGVPFTRDIVNEFHPIDDGHAANRLRRWLGSIECQRKVLVDNPARLYRFD